ncbi:MAG: hypothetical protein U0936_03645 [Planctomycetaceae bacterium]
MVIYQLPTIGRFCEVSDEVGHPLPNLIAQDDGNCRIHFQRRSGERYSKDDGYADALASDPQALANIRAVMSELADKPTTAVYASDMNFLLNALQLQRIKQQVSSQSRVTIVFAEKDACGKISPFSIPRSRSRSRDTSERCLSFTGCGVNACHVRQ